MRAIRVGIKAMVPLAAIVALMVAPSVAVGAPGYWGEYDYDPIGGTPTSEDPVTVDVSGTIGFALQGGISRNATCEVTGEVELANDWDSPSGSAAGQRILSLAPAGSVGSSCTGSYGGYCSGISDISFQSLPWAGSSHGYTYNFLSDFSGVVVEIEFCSHSSLTAYPGGTLNDAWPYANGFGQGDCIEGFVLDGASLDGSGSSEPAQLSGALEFDLDSLEGLSTDDGGPCVTLNYE